MTTLRRTGTPWTTVARRELDEPPLRSARAPLAPHPATHHVAAKLQRHAAQLRTDKRARGTPLAAPPRKSNADALLVQRSRVSKKRKSTGRAYGQGSHTTAFATYVDMLKLRVHNQTHAQAALNLQACMNEMINFLPGCRRGSRMLPYCTDQARTAVEAAIANPTKATVEAAIDKLKAMRCAVPLSTTSYGSRVVHDETNHVYLLQMEQALMRGEDVTRHRYYANRYEIIWQMFDFQPRDGVSDADVLDTIDQHLMSMQATYQILYADHTNEADALAYFLANCWDTFSEHLSDERADELRDLLTAMAASYRDV
jgi:hypothetical protein